MYLNQGGNMNNIYASKGHDNIDYFNIDYCKFNQEYITVGT